MCIRDRYIIDNGLSYDKAGMTYGDKHLGAEIYDIAGSSLFMGNEYIHIKYNLKNGRAVERMYDVYMDQNVANILEYVEVTPHAMRLRKILLDENDRKRAAK